jgi:hypothetical protein
MDPRFDPGLKNYVPNYSRTSLDPFEREMARISEETCDYIKGRWDAMDRVLAKPEPWWKRLRRKARSRAHSQESLHLTPEVAVAPLTATVCAPGRSSHHTEEGKLTAE